MQNIALKIKQREIDAMARCDQESEILRYYSESFEKRSPELMEFVRHCKKQKRALQKVAQPEEMWAPKTLLAFDPTFAPPRWPCNYWPETQHCTRRSGQQHRVKKMEVVKQELAKCPATIPYKGQ